MEWITKSLEPNDTLSRSSFSHANYNTPGAIYAKSCEGFEYGGRFVVFCLFAEKLTKPFRICFNIGEDTSGEIGNIYQSLMLKSNEFNLENDKLQ